MLLVFQVCFFVGIGLILISFLFGQMFDFLGMDALDIDVLGLDLILPVSPMVYLLFATVFGGSGLIFVKLLPSINYIFIAIIAAAIAFTLSTGFYKGIIKPLKKAENTSAPDTDELVGLPATVTETIYEKGFGEITYIINGNSYNAPAKTIKGEELVKGSKVAICWIEDHVFYVSNIDF